VKAQTARIVVMSRLVFISTLSVKPATFYTMLQVLEQREDGKIKPGRPPKLTLKDQPHCHVKR
jgi:hypothetical protein